mmetsp:Transcript_18104/g.42646  ORF Transcript_18104/g.42646 Transcript_18104/m.42646 type:complete len:378 (-) Transcript_18104:427-1560(-)
MATTASVPTIPGEPLPATPNPTQPSWSATIAKLMTSEAARRAAPLRRRLAGVTAQCRVTRSFRATMHPNPARLDSEQPDGALAGAGVGAGEAVGVGVGAAEEGDHVNGLRVFPWYASVCEVPLAHTILFVPVADSTREPPLSSARVNFIVVTPPTVATEVPEIVWLGSETTPARAWAVSLYGATVPALPITTSDPTMPPVLTPRATQPVVPTLSANDTDEDDSVQWSVAATGEVARLCWHVYPGSLDGVQAPLVTAAADTLPAREDFLRGLLGSAACATRDEARATADTVDAPVGSALRTVSTITEPALTFWHCTREPDTDSAADTSLAREVRKLQRTLWLPATACRSTSRVRATVTGASRFPSKKLTCVLPRLMLP